MNGQHGLVVQLLSAHHRPGKKQGNHAYCGQSDQYKEQTLMLRSCERSVNLSGNKDDGTQRNEFMNVEQKAIVWSAGTAQPEAENQCQQENEARCYKFR